MNSEPTVCLTFNLIQCLKLIWPLFKRSGIILDSDLNEFERMGEGYRGKPLLKSPELGSAVLLPVITHTL